MSQINGHFNVSGTENKFSGYTKQNVCLFCSAWPCVYPFHLWQCTSRVYQDQLTIARSVPTSFVPPAHNQGVDLAHFQGRAPWIVFLSTTGSFFVIAVFALPAAAPFGGRFPAAFGSLLSQLLLFFTAGFSYPYGIVQSNREDIFFYALAAASSGLWISSSIFVLLYLISLVAMV